MAVGRPNYFVAVGHAFDDVTDTLVPYGRDGVADSIGYIDGGCACLDNRRKDFGKEVQIRTHCVFGRKFHIVSVFFGNFYRFDRRIDDLLRLHFQFVLHVDGAGGDKSVNTFFRSRGNSFACFAHIVFNGTRQ